MNSAVLSPSEGLIARHLTHWVKVATNGKGGSRDHLGRGWTYLAAWDIQERIKALDFVELSTPTIYRALKSLIARGWFIREKMNAGRYRDQTYHYTFGDNHPEQTNASDQADQPDLIKSITSKLRITPVVPPSNSHKTEDIRPSTAEQPNSLNKAEVVTQPLQSITGSASTELIEELKEIEANYERRKAELTEGSNPTLSPSDLEHRIHNPRVESAPADSRAHNPKVEPSTPPLPQSGRQKGSAWQRIRALAAQFDPAAAGRVSPKAVITRDGLRLNVSDGATAPLR